jgi:hypothetical protein
MRALPQALEIIFEVQMKRSNQKIVRKKKAFQLTKYIFFPFFFSLDHSYFQSFLLSHFLFILNNLKCYKNVTWNSTNHFWILITTEQYTKNFLGVQKSTFVMLSDFFFEFLTPFTLWGRTFLISNLFSTIVDVSDASRGGVQVLFGHQKQQSRPLGSGLPWVLKCLITDWST